jgi:hypothetical protein
VYSAEHVTDSHTPIPTRDPSPDNRRTDLRTIDPHYGYREVYRLLGCDPSIEPESDTGSELTGSDPVDVAVRQALKQLGRTNS